MTPVAAPSDRRFRRAHVSPAPRLTWRAITPKLARIAIVCVVLLTGVYFGAARARSAQSLTISKISVSGNLRMSRGEVVALLEGLRGQNMLTADLESWRRKLLESPWVDAATIRRAFPGTVAVAISERQPLGIGRINDALYLVDRRGAVIDEYGPNYAEFDLPIVDGLAAAGRDSELLVDDSRAALAMRLIGALQSRPDLARRISEIDVTDVHDAVLVLKDDTALIRVGEDQFAERIQSYLDLMPALRERVPDIDYVDLRFEERLYVRPAGGREGGRRGPRVLARPQF